MYNNILFLDHQGVLYTGEYFSDKKLRAFNVECVNILNDIISETNCDIVVSSDWKLWTSLIDMQKFYSIQGIIKPIDYTPSHPLLDIKNIAEHRANEIATWLNNNHVSKWFTIDDLDMSAYLYNFLRTNPQTGLDIKSKEYIIEFFKK